jgi:predicted lipoprotein with Yx(FWY)xxD motif
LINNTRDLPVKEMSTVKTSAKTLAFLIAALGAVALLAVACSSSSKKTAQSAAPAAQSAASAAKSAASSASVATGQAVTVETHSGELGTYLTDGSGRALYLFAADTAGKSACSAACATYWPPLTASGMPAASGKASNAMLGTITRADGTKQVTYNRHPLYYYKQDTDTGDTYGQGSNNFGAKWWLVAPSGLPITGAGAASSAPASSPSSSKAGGGWA